MPPMACWSSTLRSRRSVARDSMYRRKSASASVEGTSATKIVQAAQRLGAGLGRLDQVRDDGRRNVVAVQGGIERRRVAARLRVEPLALHDGVVERRVGVDRAGIHPVKRGEGAGAIGLIAIGREN